MPLSRHIIVCLNILLLGALMEPVFGQLGFQPDIKKPPPYDNRVLKAEKTGDKKLKRSKKFFQDLSTHYNYYFNASNKLNEVIERAKSAHRDRYADLLPFYNYSLDVTAMDKTQLDSVIYKSKTGIVMHDLRNDWIDNLYLLWGASYYLEKKFDSAALMFQFINYSFADKEKDGYYRYIGSRIDGNDALNISTKEDNSFTKRLLSTPPSRNDAFIWQIRTLIQAGNLAQAGSLIATLKNDRDFPVRLQDDLEEVQAYWFYRQNIWDSSATHLSRGLGMAQTKLEKARWEYLIAQMFEKAGNKEEAENFYSRCVAHTTDPVMDIYARLNLVRLNKSGGENYIDKNIAELVKMARKDKYEEYRDVIYFMAAQMEMERKNYAAAQELLLKSAKYTYNNPISRNNTFLLIADLSYQQKKYILAAAYYDSLHTNELEDTLRIRAEARKANLSRVVSSSMIVYRQDSLQRIAAMPEDERKTFLTRLVRQLRRQQGLQDENALTSGIGINNNATTAPDLFSNTENKGEWYFYNAALKSQGAQTFKQTWGNRPNVDNWRRFSDVSQQLLARSPNNTRPGESNLADIQTNITPTYNSLLNNLPLTDAQLKVSNDSLQNALFDLGVAYQDQLEDYPSSIETLERLRSSFPDFKRMDEVLFYLYYSYSKSGDLAKAEEIKKLLSHNYTASRYNSIVTTGKDPVALKKSPPEATRDYENVYDLFLSGNFDEAEAAKKRADSIYKTNHWQPQLLYIEAVYFIKQREDSIAKVRLQTLIGQNMGTPLEKKARNLLDVLGRRKQIEEELTKLQIERSREDTAVASKPIVERQVPRPLVQGPVVIRKKDSIGTGTDGKVAVKTVPQKPVNETARLVPIQKKPASVYQFDPAAKHYAMIVMDKVDIVFVNEAKNAFNRYNQENFYSSQLNITVTDLDPDHKLLLVGDFPNAQSAIDWALKTKKVAANEIVPWLKNGKYWFSVMTDNNLEVLKNKKDLSEYSKFLEQNLPGKF